MIVRTRRQRRVLAEMQRSLSRSDPRLVARFSVFTRLTMNEAIPPFERLGGWAARRPAVVTWRRRRRAAGVPARWPIAGMLLIPVLMLMVTLLVTLGGHSAPGCASPKAAAGPGQRGRLVASRWYGLVPGCLDMRAPVSSKGG